MMTPSRALAPKRPAWFRATAAVAALSLGAYLVIAWMQPWQPGRFWGLTFGTVAAALFVNAGLYPFRRTWQARPLGTVQRWLQLHVYGSTLAMLFVFIHMGFRWPGGAFGWWLFGLAAWTTLTGLLGVALQKWVPVIIARNLKIEAIYERVPGLVERLAAEAAALMPEAGEPLAQTYQTHVRPLLASPTPRWSYVFDLRGSRGRLVEPLTRIEPFVAEADRARLQDLGAIVDEKLDLDAHLSLQRAMRVWLYSHVPAALLLLGVLAVHIVAVLYF